jgi:hypothetical protein
MGYPIMFDISAVEGRPLLMSTTAVRHHNLSLQRAEGVCRRHGPAVRRQSMRSEELCSLCMFLHEAFNWKSVPQQRKDCR